MKKSQLLPSLIAAAGFALCATPAAQADVKVGVVDMNRIFSEYYATKDAEAKINEARADAKKQLDEKMETYQANINAINKLNEEINKPELSQDARTKKGKERDEKINATKELEREITEFRTSRERDLQAQALRMRNGIVEEITKLVQERVQKDGYDLVLDKSGVSGNSVPVVLHSNESADFSQGIIDALNAKKPAASDKKADDKKADAKKK